MTDKVYNVLFLCTGNSARSIMAEALLNTLGKGRFHAYSAGSQPGGTVNPLTLEKLKALDYPTDTLRSKSWDEFAAPDAPQMDFIITVCDNAAGEVCPVWPGQPISAHWGFEDPAAAVGSEDERRHVFEKVFRQISSRINVFTSLPIAALDKAAIHRELKQIGAEPPKA
ncbi:MAG: arsenate reductase ArsC [Achromobacter spanius]